MIEPGRIEHAEGDASGRVALRGAQVLESCSYTWIFDGVTRRFRKLPRPARVTHDVPTGWRPYHRLEIDEHRSCFVVTLNPAGTQKFRAWVHSDPCDRCHGDGEPKVDRRERVAWWKERLGLLDRGDGQNPPFRPFGRWSRVVTGP